MQTLKKKLAKKTDKVQFNREKDCDEALKILGKQNTQHIKQFDIRFNFTMTLKGVLCLSQGNWSNLTNLSLSNNKIGGLGCKFLTRASMNKLRHLYLGEVENGSEGLQHLSKGKWNRLQTLKLGYQQIGRGSIRWIVKGHWTEMNYLTMPRTQYPIIQFAELILADFEFIKTIILDISFYYQQTERDQKSPKLEKILRRKFVDTKVWY